MRFLNKSILFTMLSSICLLISSCGVIEIHPENIEDISISNIDTSKINEIKEEISNFNLDDPESSVVEFAKNHDLPITEDNVSSIKEAVCNANDVNTSLGSIILNIIGIPVDESQLENIIGVSLSGFCPDKAVNN